MGAQIHDNEMKYNKIQVEDCRVFYREAGNLEKPTILLLHGFPSSSHMFRELMPELAGEYHLMNSASSSHRPSFIGYSNDQQAPKCQEIRTFDVPS